MQNSKMQSIGLEAYRERVIDAFVKHGSISDPRKYYLMEFVYESAPDAMELSEIFSRLEFVSRLTKRKDSYVVYLQDADTISDILNLIGAHKCLLDFENMRIYKSMRGNVQRKVNCETANLQKTVSASVRQTEDIEFIEEHLGFENLPESLRDIAEIRLAMPGATLQEMSEQLDPPVGKSGVNHRLRKLSRIAEELRSKNQGVNSHDQ